MDVDGIRRRQVMGLPIAAAILANTYLTDSGRDILLTDSAEGGPIIQGVAENEYLPLFLAGIIGAAHDVGSELMMFPQVAVNGMAKRFRDYVFGFVGGSAEEHHLTLRRGGSLVETPSSHRFLEAFNPPDRTLCSGAVKGLLIPTAELTGMFDRAYPEYLLRGGGISYN